MGLKDFRQMLNSDVDYVVLDTETTGLTGAEVCQIAVVSSLGEVLLDTLVKPIQPIPQKATWIHGITNEMVQDAPGWASIQPKLLEVLKGRTVVVWNAVFDRGMLHSSSDHAKLPKTNWKELSTWWCAMEAFAELYGDWNSYRKSYTWQKLTTACRYYRLPVNDAHTALGDVLMTIAVCQMMAKDDRK